MEQVLQSLASSKIKLSPISKEYRYYFKDGGLPGICFIKDDRMRNLKIKEKLAYRNIRAQLYYKLGLSFREFQFSTRGGSRIPYCIEHSGTKLGILPIESETPSASEKAYASSFFKAI